MALRDQPYLPLYIQDIMTDEKLNECCASTHGIYIKGIMCLMHKSETYGKILLKQKYKQTESISNNFALQICKHTPYSPEEITKAIEELLKEEVCFIEEDYLCQKRMIKDNAISEARSNAGKKGGGNPNFVSKLVKTKVQTNTEYKNEIENENEVNNKKVSKFVKPSIEEIRSFCIERKNKVNPETFFDFYESNGWKVGRNSMKDWKATLRRWEKNSFETKEKETKTQVPDRLNFNSYKQ